MFKMLSHKLHEPILVVLTILTILLISIISIPTVSAEAGRSQRSLLVTLTLYPDNKVVLNLDYMLKEKTIQLSRGFMNLTATLKPMYKGYLIIFNIDFCIRGGRFLPGMLHLKGNYSKGEGNMILEFLGPLTSKADVTLKSTGNNEYNISMTGDTFLLNFLPPKEALIAMLNAYDLTVVKYYEEVSPQNFKINIVIRYEGEKEVEIMDLQVDAIRGRIIFEGDLNGKIYFEEENLTEELCKMMAIYSEEANEPKIYTISRLLADKIVIKKSNVHIKYGLSSEITSKEEHIMIEGITLSSKDKSGLEGTISVLNAISEISNLANVNKIENVTVVVKEGISGISKIIIMNVPVKPKQILSSKDGKIYVFNESKILVNLSNVSIQKEELDIRLILGIVLGIALMLTVFFRKSERIWENL